MSIQTQHISSNPTYKAALKASTAIERHFAHQLADAFARGERNLAPEPNKTSY